MFLENLPTPTSSSEPATKGYVDGRVYSRCYLGRYTGTDNSDLILYFNGDPDLVFISSADDNVSVNAGSTLLFKNSTGAIILGEVSNRVTVEDCSVTWGDKVANIHFNSSYGISMLNKARGKYTFGYFL